MEEALVFRGQQRIDKILRQVIELDDAPLLPGLVEKIGHQFRGKPRFGRFAARLHDA